MIRRFYVVSAVLIAFTIAGCGAITKSIVAKQEWSKNYAAVEGVEATSPLMIDGNKSTIGETQTPAGTGGRGSAEFTEAIVTLPEKKNIRRIVLYTTNLESFSVYAIADDGKIWKPLEEIKNNSEKMIDMSVSTVTDKIRIRVRKTSDDERLPGGRSRRQVRRAKGKIREIEIYGLVEAQPTETVVTEGQASTPGIPGATAVPAEKAEEKPKAPPAVLSLESPQSAYALAGPIPLKINLAIGPDDLVVLVDSMGDEMLSTKLLVKNAAGEKIACAKPTPRVSNPRPYRGTGREVRVRNARTLDANSVVAVDIANLLEYYPITEPGNYTVQFDMKLGVHDDFVSSGQTQIKDRERTIRDIGGRANYSQTEKASLIQGLREEIEELKRRKDRRYLIVGRKGKPLELTSNVLELVIQ